MTPRSYTNDSQLYGFCCFLVVDELRLTAACLPAPMRLHYGCQCPLTDCSCITLRQKYCDSHLIVVSSDTNWDNTGRRTACFTSQISSRPRCKPKLYVNVDLSITSARMFREQCVLRCSSPDPQRAEFVIMTRLVSSITSLDALVVSLLVSKVDYCNSVLAAPEYPEISFAGSCPS